MIFISLNYDLLIDNAIEELSIQTGQHALPDYGVKFTPEPHRDNILFPRTNLLLKLHGSLNWLYCPTCNNLSLFPGHKIAAELPGGPWRFHCQECREIRVPIIIPPTFFKVMSNFYLQQIWKRAEEELKKANRIVFCGYSFPDADMHIKYLLKRAEVNRVGEAPEVFIVNEHKGKKKQGREMEMDRYMRFFRQKDKVHWTKLSFKQFAANPTLIEDSSKWL
jgi:NAD-dependent SIR2 family protein deacetylase